MVAWTLRNDAAAGARWHRWQSPGLTTRGEWQQAWDRAARLGAGRQQRRSARRRCRPDTARELAALYFRNDNWGPAVGADALGAATPLPDGIRLVLSLPPGPALAGLLTRDWVRPTATVPKS